MSLVAEDTRRCVSAQALNIAWLTSRRDKVAVLATSASVRMYSTCDGLRLYKTSRPSTAANSQHDYAFKLFGALGVPSTKSLLLLLRFLRFSGRVCCAACLR